MYLFWVMEHQHNPYLRQEKSSKDRILNPFILGFQKINYRNWAPVLLFLIDNIWFWESCRPTKIYCQGVRPGDQHWPKISWQRVKGSDAWKKQNLCDRLYQKVGNYFPVVKNQIRSFFPLKSQIEEIFQALK